MKLINEKVSQRFSFIFISNDTTFLYFFTNEVCKMDINVKGKRKVLACHRALRILSFFSSLNYWSPIPKTFD